MKKFKFRLERVLQYRNTIKGEKMKELALCNHKLRVDEERLQRLLGAADTNGVKAKGLVSSSLLSLVGLYGRRLKAEIEHQHDVILESEEAANEALNRYIEANREARALELLKRRKFEEYKEYVQQQDNKFLDELAVQKGNTIYTNEG